MTKDFVEKFREKIMESTLAMVQEPSLDASNKLITDMIGMLEDAAAQGIELPSEIATQIASLNELLAVSSQMELAQADGDMDRMMELSGTVGDISGINTAYEPNPEIFDAVEGGDLDAVLDCLKQWDVNQGHGAYNATVLYHAVATSGVEPSFSIMHALLDAGADPRIGLGPNSGVLSGFGFGHYKPDHVDDLEVVIRRCVSLGADLEQRSENLNWTPLHTAFNEWNGPVVEALLRAGSDPNAAAATDAGGCTAGQTCLGMVMSKPDLLGLLLDHGADLDRADGFGRTVRQQIVQHLQTAEDGDWKTELEASVALVDARSRVS